MTVTCERPFDRRRAQLVDAADRVDAPSIFFVISVSICSGDEPGFATDDRHRREVDVGQQIDAQAEERERRRRPSARGRASWRTPDAGRRFLRACA